MEIKLHNGGIHSWAGTVLLVGLLNKNLESNIKELEEYLEFKIETRLKHKKFTGEIGDKAIFEVFQGKHEKIIFVGLGEPENLSLNDLRKAAAIGAKSSVGCEGELGIFFPWEAFDPTNAAKAVAEATRLALFKDIRFKSEDSSLVKPSNLELIGLNKSSLDSIKDISPICSGVEFARELVGSPPNELTPSSMAGHAVKLAKDFNLKINILEKQDCEKRNMGAYLAVAKGSDLPPKFIHLIYQPKEKINHRIALVGKGLTFDSGGYNLKVGAAQIDLMKFDMGGSAAVLGAARSIAELRPKNIEVHFIVAACENMINGSAVHPGDIVKASNGKTIEINNTDAEGRLTLADALVYACDLNPDLIIDLATLTGACVIALGDEIAGLWTESDQLADDLINAANSAGEGLWRMPLKSSYKEGLKSMLADMKNTGPRQGGSITAALFLKEFVSKEVNWAHIDIAGPVWSDKDRGINPAGATGFGVRTLVNLISSLNKVNNQSRLD